MYLTLLLYFIILIRHFLFSSPNFCFPLFPPSVKIEHWKPKSLISCHFYMYSKPAIATALRVKSQCPSGWSQQFINFSAYLQPLSFYLNSLNSLATGYISSPETFYLIISQHGLLSNICMAEVLSPKLVFKCFPSPKASIVTPFIIAKLSPPSPLLTDPILAFPVRCLLSSVSIGGNNCFAWCCVGFCHTAALKQP